MFSNILHIYIVYFNSEMKIIIKVFSFKNKENDMLT